MYYVKIERVSEYMYRFRLSCKKIKTPHSGWFLLYFVGRIFTLSYPYRRVSNLNTCEYLGMYNADQRIYHCILVSTISYLSPGFPSIYKSHYSNRVSWCDRSHYLLGQRLPSLVWLWLVVLDTHFF